MTTKKKTLLELNLVATYDIRRKKTGKRLGQIQWLDTRFCFVSLHSPGLSVSEKCLHDHLTDKFGGGAKLWRTAPAALKDINAAAEKYLGKEDK